MSLGGHLKELRRRFIISVIAILVGTVGGWIVSPWVFDRLQEPIRTVAEKYGTEAALNFDTISGSFDLTLQMALTIGVVASSPIWLWQIWGFITPGLVKHERAYAIGFLLAAFPLFLAGCFVGWVVFPRIVELLVGFTPSDSIANLSARYYYDFVLKLMIAAGVAFVLPVVLVMLNFAGVLSARQILKGWRIAIVVIVTFTAATTPATDIMSMLFLAVPMVLLYFIAAFIAWVHDRRKAKREAAFLASELA